MSFKIFFIFVGMVALFGLQTALTKSLPGGIYINLSLVILIFLLVLFGLEQTIGCWLLSGFLVDLFSFRLFGFYTVLFCGILLFVYWLLSNVLTNRSLYSFLLIITMVTVIYDAANWLVFGFPADNLMGTEIKRLLANWVVTIISFYIVSWMSYRLKPVFLIKR
jgi:hypothetical protein